MELVLWAIWLAYLDPANWALQLTAPRVWSASRKDVHSEYAYPNKSIVKFEFPARAGMGPVTLYWYDGGNMPPRPEGVADDEKPGDGDNGSYFVGTEGTHPGTYGGGTRLVGKKKGEINEEEIPTIPRAPEGIGNKKDDDMRHTLTGCMQLNQEIKPVPTSITPVPSRNG